MKAFYFTFALLGLAPLTRAAEKPRMNVLFIISDDLNNSLGCYGDPLVKTPNIDRLAARGVRFDRAYCTYSLCGPSRNSFLTGLYPNSTGILTNGQVFRQTIPEAVSMPQAFRQQGYLAARVGKLYHFSVPNSIGTDGHDDPASWEIQMNPAGVDRTEDDDKIFALTPGNFGSSLSWYASPKSDEFHTDGLNANDTEWLLEGCAKHPERPFFIGCGFFRPHTPYVAPENPYFGYYPLEKMPVVSGVAEDRKDIPPAALMSEKKDLEKLNDDLRRKARQAYYASISFMDAQVGRVVATLDRLGLADRTIIVFTSDHGYHLGEHGLWQKHSLFEEAARVPLLIVAPGVSQPGSVVKTPVSHLDLCPTLTELAGVKPPANIQGQSLVPILKDVSQSGRGWALTEVTRGNVGKLSKSNPFGEDEKHFAGYSLRTLRWRYTEWDGGKQGHELYDHDADPRELTNLADDPAQAETVADLGTQLRKAIKGTFPASGVTPQLREKDSDLWTPIFVPASKPEKGAGKGGKEMGEKSGE